MCQVCHINEASNMDWLQYISLKIICYFQGMFLKYKSEKCHFCKLYPAMPLWPENTLGLNSEKKEGEEVKYASVCQINAALCTKASQYMEPMNTGFYLPKCFPSSRTALSSWTCTGSFYSRTFLTVVTRINLVH